MEQQVAALIKNMIGQALLDSANDGDEMQLVKFATDLDSAPTDGDDVQDGIERIQEYGITSNPPRGSEIVVLYPGGKKDSGLVIKVDSAEYRIQGLETGEVCIYSMHGQKILLRNDGDIVFNDGDNFAVKYNELSAKFDALFNLVKTHVHPGVTVGSGSTLVITPTPATIDISDSKAEGIRL